MRIIKSLWAMMPRTAGRPAGFILLYHPADGASPVTVGHLRFDSGTWTFYYDEEFKLRRDEFHPIEGFDQLERVYSSPALFPFFAVRIPDIERPDVRSRLEAEHLTDPEPSDLLRMFGRKVVSSPAFELVPT
ncbi:MAG: hypothetical protein K2Y23_13730 [Cyanobacteria bacterium]|nr:hypothetical protein [Cyanobacteriota bacterium]